MGRLLLSLLLASFAQALLPPTATRLTTQALISELLLPTLEDGWQHVVRGLRARGLLQTPVPPPTRKKILVLGSGWASHAFCKVIDTQLYEVVCVSPTPYFAFTPLLPACAVGCIEYRSIMEPVRVSNPEVTFIEGEAVDVFPDQALATVQPVLRAEPFNLTYDYLLYAVGSTNNDFGVSGVREHCYFLKDVQDAKRLKRAIVRAFEEASFPDTPPDEIARLLHFVVVGGGPTGVEISGDLTDFINDVATQMFPRLRPLARISLLTSGGSVLESFASSLQAAALTTLRKTGISVTLRARVLAVNSTRITYRCASAGSDPTVVDVDYGLCIWAAGTAATPLSRVLAQRVGDWQREAVARGGRLVVDSWLRLADAAAGAAGPSLRFPSPIFAVGDCAGPVIDYDAPAESASGRLLPQTAQVAAQQAPFVARLLNKQVDVHARLPRSGRGQEAANKFQFINLGILASLGSDEAVAQLQLGDADLLTAQGRQAYWLWRSVYVVKQVSLRTRLLVLFDFWKTAIFGRDITSV